MGGKAIGLSGTDGGLVRAHIADERLGFVGEIDAIDSTPIEVLIKEGYIPIIAPLGEGPDGSCLNINADLVAAAWCFRRDFDYSDLDLSFLKLWIIPL